MTCTHTRYVDGNNGNVDIKINDRRIILYTSNDSTNCKLSYIHGVGYLAVFEKNDDRKMIIDTVLKYLKGCVIINTTDKSVSDWISENYLTYYYQKVPIGYNNKYQYHICIKNNINTNNNCRKPVTDTDLLRKKPFLTKDKIKNTLLKVLKDRRRKADYIDEFLTLLD